MVNATSGIPLYEEMYDIMNLHVGSNTFTWWAMLSELAGKKRGRVYERYIPRLKKEHNGAFENVEKVMEYKKTLGTIKDRIPQMEDILNKELDANMLMDIYKQQVQEQIKGNVATKVKAMLDSMEDDLVTARAVTLQACMLAITWYFASIQKRVKDGKEIYTKEFKSAYEIYKTEMWEPTKIKETRTKNMQVTLQVPISKEDVKQILGANIRQDLSIEVADVYKDKLDGKFNLNQHKVDDESWWDNVQGGWDRVITEAEEVPN